MQKSINSTKKEIFWYIKKNRTEIERKFYKTFFVHVHNGKD